MPSNEAAVLKSITDFLQWNNWPVYRMNAGTFQDKRSDKWIKGQEQGCPDLCVGYLHPVYKVHLLAWIEVKDKSLLSDAQVSFIRRINKLGCPWLVARSVQDVEQWMKDSTYHGSQSDTDRVLDESRKFIPAKMLGKKRRLPTALLREYNNWADKYEPPIPF